MLINRGTCLKEDKLLQENFISKRLRPCRNEFKVADMEIECGVCLQNGNKKHL